MEASKVKSIFKLALNRVPASKKLGNNMVSNSTASVAVAEVELKPSESSATSPSFKEVYHLREPYIHAAVSTDPETQISKYHVIEPALVEEDKQSLAKIKEIMFQVLDISLSSIGQKDKAEEWLNNFVRKIIKNYKIPVSEGSLDKIQYYLSRDLIHFGKIDPLMYDHMIEDISCDGPGVPVYIWHRSYESLPTNIIFESDTELDSFIVRLAYLAGKHISIANPMLDASLSDGSRIQLTYAREITRKGGTFTIRRFRADPLSVADLIAFNTFNPMMAAWFWILLERKCNMLIGGGTASGKTTTLNSLCTFIPTYDKVVTIEDTAELNIPLENWISAIARVGFGSGGAADITLFDLLKAAMRQRPDYVIVGEVRGTEAFTLFQAMATGHGGISSLHCDSVSSAFSRLENEPMNIPRTLMTILDVVVMQAKVRLAEHTTRRIRNVVEVVEMDPVSKEIITNEVFKWDPRTDAFEYSGKSVLLDRIARDFGLTQEYLDKELERRGELLAYLAKSDIKRVPQVGRVIRDYYADPEKVYDKVRLKLTV